jgi:hypothetical protein
MRSRSGGYRAREVSLALLVANGVTGVRDMGGDFELIKALRKEIAGGSLPGPHIITAGLQFTGASKDCAQQLASNSEEAGRRSVISLKQAGVDLIKVLPFVPPDVCLSTLAGSVLCIQTGFVRHGLAVLEVAPKDPKIHCPAVA